jgi:Beta-lactamase enzyme family
MATMGSSHSRGTTAGRTDFWPASTIKLYTVIAALELLNERGLDFATTTAAFECRDTEGKWTLDCARGVREMISEIFRRSSNEDYTLLLRFTGLDGINAQFLTPEHGFPHSALMRGYVSARPWKYATTEPQRITLRATDGKTERIEHTWGGRFYAEERGGAQIDARTGNVTSARELAECLRRVMFHEHLPESERYRLTDAQLAFLRSGGDGFTGLETKAKESGPSAWTGGVEVVFPKARFFHKCGLISNYASEVAYVDDSANGGPRFILVPVIAAGSASKPESGEKLIGQMSRAIAEWVKTQPK